MSVTFSRTGSGHLYDEDGNLLVPYDEWMNLANTNARDLLSYLGLPSSDDLYGSMPARELAAKCRRRLWPEIRERDDEGIEPTVEFGTQGARFFGCGRPAGRLAEYTEHLLIVCEKAGDDTIQWG